MDGILGAVFPTTTLRADVAVWERTRNESEFQLNNVSRPTTLGSDSTSYIQQVMIEAPAVTSSLTWCFNKRRVNGVLATRHIVFVVSLHLIGTVHHGGEFDGSSRIGVFTVSDRTLVANGIKSVNITDIQDVM